MEDSFGGPQSVLVLGATSDIAQATVARLARYRLSRAVLAARPGPRLEAAVAAARFAGVDDVATVAFDAGDTAGHAGLVDKVWADHGDVDLVVIAFGALGDQASLAEDPEAAADLARTNYVGGVSTGLAVAGRLRAQGHGALVVLSSVAGERARRSNFVYGSTKAGLDTFAQGLADDLAGAGVHVLIVRPGFVHTKMTAGLDPPPISAGADDVAAAIVDGLARGRDVVWVPGHLRWLFVGLRHLPRPLWRMASRRL